MEEMVSVGEELASRLDVGNAVALKTDYSLTWRLSVPGSVTFWPSALRA